jgi:hypothetical protein
VIRRIAACALFAAIGAAPASAWIAGDQGSAWFGFAVAGAGDVDGDALDDVLIGALLRDGGQPNEGAALLYRGLPPGVDPQPPIRIESDSADAHLGSLVSGAGDVNGDGFDDVLVGADGFDDEGAAFVFHGGPSGIASGGVSGSAGRLSLDEPFAGLGFGDARAGDINGDGKDDVLLGARFFGGRGGAFVFHGSATGVGVRTAAAADARIEATLADSEFGASCGPAGDLNGDGWDDVVVGAPEEDGRGAVYVFHGGPAGIAAASPAQASTRLVAASPGSRFGWSVHGAGDVNHDGFDDLVVGAPLGGAAMGGAAYVFLGRAAGIADGSATGAAFSIESATPEARLGSSVAGARLDPDAFSDVIIGAPTRDGVAPGAGAVLVLNGSADFPIGAHARVHRAADRAFAQLGFAVAIAGDTNGDGTGEWIAGAPFRSDGDDEEGAVLVAAPEASSGVAALGALLGLLAASRCVGSGAARRIRRAN